MEHALCSVYSQVPARVEYYSYVATFMIKSLKASFMFVMNMLLSKNVGFYSIIILLYICEEQMIEYLNPVCRRFLSFYGKISGFRINNSCCNRQENVPNKPNLSNV
jgi:hypothetical protein